LVRILIRSFSSFPKSLKPRAADWCSVFDLFRNGKFGSLYQLVEFTTLAQALGEYSSLPPRMKILPSFDSSRNFKKVFILLLLAWRVNPLIGLSVYEHEVEPNPDILENL